MVVSIYQRTGRPEASNRAEFVERVFAIIGTDTNFTTRLLAEELNTSKNSIWRILTEVLSKRKVCAFDEKTDNSHPFKQPSPRTFL